MYSKKIVPHNIFIQIINLIFVSLKSRLFSLWLTERLPWMFTICYKQLFTNHYTTWMILYTNCSFAFNHHRPTRLVLVLISTNWIFVFEEGPTHPQWVLSLSIGPPLVYTVPGIVLFVNQNSWKTPVFINKKVKSSRNVFIWCHTQLKKMS